MQNANKSRQQGATCLAERHEELLPGSFCSGTHTAKEVEQVSHKKAAGTTRLCVFQKLW